jgi:hypothetical protein
MNKIEKEIKEGEYFIFSKFKQLRKHHQAIFGLIIVTAVVLIWRGAWNLIDRYFIPSMPNVSDLVGIGVGLVLLVVTHFVSSQLIGNN